MSQGAPRKATPQEVYLQIENALGQVVGQIANIRAGLEIPFRMGILQNPEYATYHQAIDKLYEDGCAILAGLADETKDVTPDLNGAIITPVRPNHR